MTEAAVVVKWDFDFLTKKWIELFNSQMVFKAFVDLYWFQKLPSFRGRCWYIRESMLVLCLYILIKGIWTIFDLLILWNYKCILMLLWLGVFIIGYILMF